MAEAPASKRDEIGAVWSALGEAGSGAVRERLKALPPQAAGSAEGLRLSARAAWREGLSEAAITRLADALEAAPQDSGILTDLAVLLLEAGNPETARQLLTAALEHDATLPEAHAALASLAEDAGEMDSALRHLRAACAGALARRHAIRSGA